MVSKIHEKLPSRFLRISLLQTFPARRHHVLRQRLVFVQELVECAHDIGHCGGSWPFDTSGGPFVGVAILRFGTEAKRGGINACSSAFASRAKSLINSISDWTFM